MMNQTRKNTWFYKTLLTMSGAALFVTYAPAPTHAQDQIPSLTITNDSLPNDIKSKIYSKPARVREISPREVSGSVYYQPSETIVAEKLQGLERNLELLKSKVFSLSDDLNTLQRVNEGRSAEYFAAVATINTQLQSGTTPGNPRLLERLSLAEKTLESMAGSINGLSQIAVRAANISSEANFLSDESRSAYRISGAVEEDHVQLSKLEDGLENTTILIERVLDNVSDDITRMSAHLSAERTNLRTLSLAVANGDLYGRALSARPFSSIDAYQSAHVGAPAGLSSISAASAAGDSPPAPMPLVKIRFNRPDVDYEQPVYSAMNEALARYPNARFDLIAIHPMRGNAAQIAIESTRARRNAEKVLRTVTQMGLPLDRINLSYNESEQASSTEVHIYVR